jgi:hypothetical protein
MGEGCSRHPNLRIALPQPQSCRDGKAWR